MKKKITILICLLASAFGISWGLASSMLNVFLGDSVRNESSEYETVSELADKAKETLYNKKEIVSESETGILQDTEFYMVLNDNLPRFDEEDLTRTDPFEYYSDLDYLGRCGVAYANICKELMPDKEREGIGHIKPTGWHTVKYEGIDGNYLYNRCHLIGFQLAGENANIKNLITGTRSLNVDGMLPFENEVADYVRSTGNHVLYRVTPFFEGNNLLCKGVKMEAYSVEDKGDGVCFNVFVYNAQPGIGIDYKDGYSWEITY